MYIFASCLSRLQKNISAQQKLWVCPDTTLVLEDKSKTCDVFESATLQQKQDMVWYAH